MMRARDSGFTIVELMIVLAIVGILTMLAAPSFQPIIESQRAKSAAGDLYIALTRARSEAAKQNAEVRIAPKSGNTDWALGWTIVDPTTNAIIEDHGTVPGLTVTGPADVRYRGSGRVQGSAPAFSISGNFADSTRCVSADLSGRPLVRNGAC